MQASSKIPEFKDLLRFPAFNDLVKRVNELDADSMLRMVDELRLNGYEELKETGTHETKRAGFRHSTKRYTYQLYKSMGKLNTMLQEIVLQWSFCNECFIPINVSVVAVDERLRETYVFEIMKNGKRV